MAAHERAAIEEYKIIISMLRSNLSLSDKDLDEYERWLEVPDLTIFNWVNGSQPTPAEYDTALFRRLRDFHYGEPKI